MACVQHLASSGDDPPHQADRCAHALDRALVVASLLIVAIWAIAASRWILTDAVVPWDSKNQFYAFFRFLASALHSGATPFWNPYHYGGHPAAADPQSLIFAPPFFLWALFDPAPSMRAFDLMVYAHLLVGGLAVGVIGRRAGWPAAAGVLAAALFMFGGSAAARLQHTGAIIAYALFPLALLLMQLALERRSYVAAAACACAAATIALERNHTALLIGFVLGAALFARIATQAQPLRYLRKRIGVLAAMGATALALVTPPTLLTLQFAALSNRPVMALERALEASLYPVNLATLAVANVFGSNNWPTAAWPYPYWGPNGDTVPEVGATDLSFNYLFVGVAAIVVLLWFGVAGGGAWRRGRRLLAGVLVVSLLYMLGRYTPFYRVAFEWVPGVDMFRRPVGASFIFLAALALMCGHLLADYVREGRPPLAPMRLLAPVAGAALMLVWAVAFSARTGHALAAAIEIAKALAIAALAIAALAIARTPRARAWAAAAVTALAIAELLWWNTASRLNAEPHSYYAVLERPEPAEAHALAALTHMLSERNARGDRPRIEVVGAGGPWQNLAMVHGIEATNGYNPLRVGFYDRLVEPGESTYAPDQRSFPRSFDNYDCALAHALGLEYLVLGEPIEKIPGLARRPVAELLQRGPDVWIYRLKGAMPRVSFAGRVQVADAGDGSASALPRAAPSPDRALIDDDTPPSHAYAAAGSGSARIVSWRADRVEIELDAATPGVLVLHDLYYPGWVAEVDGKPARILRGDILFRAVEAPAGHHRVVFRFAPFSLANLADAARLAFGWKSARP